MDCGRCWFCNILATLGSFCKSNKVKWRNLCRIQRCGSRNLILIGRGVVTNKGSSRGSGCVG